MYPQQNTSQKFFFDDSTLLDMEFDSFYLSSDIDSNILDNSIDPEIVE